MTTPKVTPPGFPKVSVRISQYEGSLTDALQSFGKALNSGLERWLRKLGGNPEALPTLEQFRRQPYLTLNDQFSKSIEAAMQDGDIAKLAEDVLGLIFTAFPTAKRKGAPRRQGDRDARLWRLYHVEKVGSYGQIALRPEFRVNSKAMDTYAVAAAIKRKDAEADKFRDFVFSLKAPLRTLGINLVGGALPRSTSPRRSNPSRN